MIFVKNKKNHTTTPNDFYIGRGSVLGNPFTSITNRPTKADFLCETREESIERYRDYLKTKIIQKDALVCDELNRIYLAAKKSDVNLVCFCSPLPCHGDIIKKIIEDKL